MGVSPWNPTCLHVSAGTDIIAKTVQAFLNPASRATAIIDLHAYDGFSALAALQAMGPCIFVAFQCVLHIFVFGGQFIQMILQPLIRYDKI